MWVPAVEATNGVAPTFTSVPPTLTLTPSVFSQPLGVTSLLAQALATVPAGQRGSVDLTASTAGITATASTRLTSFMTLSSFASRQWGAGGWTAAATASLHW